MPAPTAQEEKEERHNHSTQPAQPPQAARLAYGTNTHRAAESPATGAIGAAKAKKESLAFQNRLEFRLMAAFP